MLHSVFTPLISLMFILVGLFVVGFGVRIALGSNEAYDQLKGVSKGFRNTLFGDTNQPKGRGGILYNRGIAYSVDKQGKIELHSQAKTNRESVKDASV